MEYALLLNLHVFFKLSLSLMRQNAVTYRMFGLFVTVSLDRGRHEFENRERELMDDVRRMRQKLARESRMKRPPPVGLLE